VTRVLYDTKSRDMVRYNASTSRPKKLR